MRIDVHQHLWPEEFVAALRRRRRVPRLDGWTLHLDGEPELTIDPAAHDPLLRRRQAADDGLDLVLISLSSPLGIEWLPIREARPLIDAYHEGAAKLPAPFRTWAAAGLSSIDPGAVTAALDQGCAGLQLPATALLDAAGYARCAPLLDLLAERDLPLFVHPGAAARSAGQGPPWWPPLVPYVQQLHQAWYAFRAFGRPRYPRLRVCFAALAGLAPLHGERFAARGGGAGTVDPHSYVETSSYGPRAIDATTRALAIDVIVHGSDRPYATSAEHRLGPAADHALHTTNPRRLLGLTGDNT